MMDYKQWRELWHSEAKKLGWHVHFNIKRGRPIMDKHTWMLHDRLRRIQLRLDVEREASTESYLESVLDMLYK